MTYAVSASFVLTGYYFARLWAGDNRAKTMSIRDKLNDEFSVERLKEQRKLERATKDEQREA